MKKCFLALAVFVVTSLAFGAEVANYHIKKGKLHTGGKAQVEVIEKSADKFSTKLNYQIYKKILVPIPEDQLQGETIFEFPPEFGDERGYLELETKGVIELEKAQLQFVKRVTWRGLANAYQVLILPKNGRSKIEAIYHPSLKASGWAKVIVTFINSVPIFNGYQIVIELD